MHLRERTILSLLALLLLLVAPPHARADDGRFDLTGPRIDVRITRITASGETQTLPIASVPNLQPGDRIWLHPDLPATQSVHYLLICVFLRGTTNPPPDQWFTRIETWDRKVREEGVFVTVPEEAQQAVLFLAPETGGDFSTLRSAVKGRPGVFVRAQQDLVEAGFEQARIEKYLASIRRVPPSDPAALLKRSDLLARTLALKPNDNCFKQPVDTQFTCLTQTGSQVLLDDTHAQSIVSALSNGPGGDLANQASYTQLAGAGVYSAYVGAIVDLVRIMGSLHTAQYQYIPAIAFPDDAAMNLRLNTPPSFKNPKSVLVIGLPAVQKAVPPPLRPADANHVACLLEPTVVLPIEGAPLVFSTAFAHDLKLHLDTPPGAPAEPDIALIADAYQGGLVLNRAAEHHVPLEDPGAPRPLSPNPFAHPALAQPAAPSSDKPEPILLTGTITGRWGFDAFTGPAVKLQQLPGGNWHIVTPESAATAGDLIAGHAASLEITSTGSACVHTITTRPAGATADLKLDFKPTPKPDQPNLLTVTLPLDHAVTPGDLHLAVQQFDQPQPDVLSTRTFAEPPHIASIELHAADKSLVVNGTRLSSVDKLTLGDLTFTPTPDDDPGSGSLRLGLPADAPAPPTRLGEHLTANIALTDGRNLTAPVIISSPRPVFTLLRKSIELPPNANISLANSSDLPLNATLTFTLKTPTPFPRNGQLEIETLDGTLRTVLTLAPSGGLILQDPHTVVATLDPQRSFGPSAFGALHLRAVYPATNLSSRPEVRSETITNLSSRPASQSDAAERLAVPATNSYAPTSDWLPLATLVRLPTLTQLTCPADATQPCTVTGSNFFLIDSVSTDPAFANPAPVPDGYTGSTLTVPHPTAGTLFLRLRDDPTPIDAANIPAPTPPQPPAAHAHSRHLPAASAQSQQPNPAPSATQTQPGPQSAAATRKPATTAEPQTQTPRN
jgi:hypothetical protein